MLSNYFKNLSGFQKVIFSIITLFFVFNLALLITSLLMETNDLKQMVKMARYISYMKYVVIINMILLSIILFMYYYEIKKLKRINKEFEEKTIGLKSDLYEATKSNSDIKQRV
jgi:hypothetical protein